MNKIAALLLVTTALSPLLPGHARASTVTVIESEVLPGGVFGKSFATATPIAADVGEIVGNVDHYLPGFDNKTNVPDFLDIQAAGFKAFQLMLTVSPVNIITSDPGVTTYAAGAFATTGATTSGSRPTLTPLSGSVGRVAINTPVTVGSSSTLGGMVHVVSSAGASASYSTGSPGTSAGAPGASSTGSTGTSSAGSPGASGSASSGGSLTGALPTTLDPILTFYNASGALIDTVDLTASTGNRVTLSGTLDGASDLWVGVNTPFDYELATTFSDPVSPDGGTTAPINGTVPVPEPASAAMLGIGLAALAVAKRKKRPV